MKTTLVLAVLLSAAATASADEVTLKSGRKITNCIATTKGDKVIVEIGAGTATFKAEEVLTVEEGPCALKDYPAKLAAAKEANKAADWYALAGWCRDNGVSRGVTPALQKTIELDKNHEGARRALGYVLVERTWMTKDEANAARGMVKFEGKWMTPLEVELVKAKRLRELEMKVAKQEEAERRAEEAARLAQEQADQQAELMRRQALEIRTWRGWNPYGGWRHVGAPLEVIDLVDFLQWKGYWPK